MSFILRKIEMKDWLVYGGAAELVLPSPHEGKNLVVVNGQNGFGKTSLLRALEFVFKGGYGKSELFDVWNEQARADKEGSLSVGIEFEHSGRIRKIVRGADFRSWGDRVACTPWLKLFVDGTEQQDQVEDKIEQLLPAECLEFVFFDGAEISRYAQKNQRDGVKDAIEKVLGIPAVRNLRTDLGHLVRDLEEEQGRLLGSAKNAEVLLHEIDDLKSQDEGYRERRRKLVDERSALEKTLQELEKEAEGVEAIEASRKELKEKYLRRADYEEKRHMLDEEIRGLTARAPILMLKGPLQSIVEELRAKAGSSPRRDLQRATLTVLKDVVERDQCLCRREMDGGIASLMEQEIDRLERLLSAATDISPEDDDTRISLTAILRSLEANPTSGEDLIDRRAANETRWEEVNTDILRLEAELQGHEEVTIRELYQQIGSVKKQRDEKVENLCTVDTNTERLSKEQQLKQRELDGIGATNVEAQHVTLLLEETRKLHAAVDALVEDLVKQKRLAIEERATEVFRAITNKPIEYDRIRVSPDYTLEILRRDGTSIENPHLSAGEKEVLAYSFITALNLASVDPAPFVMDTPFGHLDSGHRKGLLSSIPKLEVQAILLATDRDLPPTERDAVDRAITKEFTLKRDQKRALTTIEEE